ncbi:MAG: PAS domain S-box protein, partial [Lysobacteraceae bacterium]
MLKGARTGATTIATPSHSHPLPACVIPLGIGGSIGSIVVASVRAGFPSENEFLLLRVGANQAAVALQRHLGEQALAHANSRFLDLANAAPAMLWVTDPDGTCSFLSRGWYDFTGQARDAGLGFGWIEAIHPEDRPGAAQSFQDANANRREFSLEHRLRHADGSYRWVIDAGRPRSGPQGEFLGFVGNVFDIDDRKRTEEALQVAEVEHRRLFDELKKSNKNLSEFLAVLAHELRNPLAPIMTGMEVLRMRTASPETMAQVRGIIERQVRQLSHLVDDLLDLARVTNGKVEIRREAADLNAIVSDAVETSLPLIEHAHHAFSTRLHDAALPVHADPVRIAQVINNLLTNAAKYTPRGGHIALTVERDGDEAVISVIDDRDHR